MDYKKLRPTQILLDAQNPRLPDGTSNDREAINRLLAEGPTQMIALARDLVDRGESNPSELPIVMRDGSKYVVLEGNRRFAALKLLANPRLADDPGQRAAFERMSKRGAPPRTLFCAVADSREQADYWITLRHTGANDGVGVRGWNAPQTARHRTRMNAPIDSGTIRAIAIADELEEAYQSDTDLVDLIKKVRSERLTNIGRFFSGVTLTRMQLAVRPITDGERPVLMAKHTAAQLHDYFWWAFGFLDSHSVDAFKNDDIRGDLLNGNGHLIPNAETSLEQHQRLADSPFSRSGEEPQDGVAAGSSDAPADSHRQEDTSSEPARGDGEQDSSGPTNASDESTRRRDRRDERSIYSEVRLPNLSSNIQRLLREARNLPINDNYAISCVLARVILELVVSEPSVLKWSGAKESATLETKVRKCIRKLDPEIDNFRTRTRQDLVQANLEIANDGIAYMHQFMHNSHARPDPHLARRYSTVFSPLLISINEAMS